MTTNTSTQTTDKDDDTMSTQNTEASDEAANTNEAETEHTQDEPDTKGGNEAAKYRRRLRDTETERDTLRGQVAALQRAEVERLASHLTRPSAVWSAGVELGDCLNSDGAVDPDKAMTAITTAAEALGLARAPRTPRPDPTQGGAGGSGPTGPAFADAFGPRR